MSDYKPPVKDMFFVLKHVVGLDGLPKVQSGELDDDTLGAILEEASKLASQELAPLNAAGDHQGSVLNADGSVTTPKGFKEAYRTFIDGGWNGVQFDEEYGGMDLPFVVSFSVQEMVHGANMSFGLCPMLTQAAVEALHQYGSDEQKAAYLEKLVSGEWTGSMQLTEPHAGSDLGILKAKAEKQGDGTYKVSGQKIFITYGEHDFTDNIIHMVLARVEGAPEGVKGISMFIIPKILDDGTVNDAGPIKLEEKLGIHASPTCVMQYGDKGGATAYLLGQENEGLKYMFTMMNNARLGVGMQGVALAERAYQHALAYAHDRVQGAALSDKTGTRVPIIEHADVRRMLLSMKARIEAGRALSYEAALAVDQAKTGEAQAQNKVELLTPLVKAWCTDMAVDVASTGIQIHGGMGFIEETGAAQYYRDARILPIYEGTNGIQAADLAFRKTLMNGGALAQEWFAETRGNIADLKANAECKALGEELEQAVSDLEKATEHLLNSGANDLDSVAAVSVPYLNAFGTIAAGAMMARSALAADKLRQQGEDADFCASKKLTAAFYSAHIMPQYKASLETVMRGSQVVNSFTPKMF